MCSEKDARHLLLGERWVLDTGEQIDGLHNGYSIWGRCAPCILISSRSCMLEAIA